MMKGRLNLEHTNMVFNIVVLIMTCLGVAISMWFCGKEVRKRCKTTLFRESTDVLQTKLRQLQDHLRYTNILNMSKQEEQLAKKMRQVKEALEEEKKKEKAKTEELIELEQQPGPSKKLTEVEPRPTVIVQPGEPTPTAKPKERPDRYDKEIYIREIQRRLEQARKSSS